MESGRVSEEFVEGHFIPAKDIQRIQMIYDCQSIEFMETWDDAAVLDVRKSADMQDELGPPARRRQFETRPFDIAIR